MDYTDESFFLKDDGGADGLIFGGTHQSDPANRHNPVNTSQNGGFVTEEDYKTLKLESNLQNLNKDLLSVNEEIEQIKRMLL